LQKLERTTFETSRASEYFDARELQTQTGQRRENFPHVVLKELVDNALDACETAGVAPRADIQTRASQETIELTILDNGPGIQPDLVGKVLNFDTRTSDKAAYRSPTRGAQGNALKTVVGIPYALGGKEPVVIEARGQRHTIRAWQDPAGEIRTPREVEVGT
jgi:DNA topoisomerase VI subunit B